MERQTEKKKAFTLIGPKDHDSIKKLRRERTHKGGFTLIELIVVMAVIGVLVLLATPKFLGYTQKAQNTKDIHTVKVIETALEAYLINGGEFPDGLEIVDKTSLDASIVNKNIVGVNGYITSVDDETYYELTYSFIKDNLDIKLSVQNSNELFLTAQASASQVGPSAIYASTKGLTLIDKEKILTGYPSSADTADNKPDYSEYLATDGDFEWVSLNADEAYFIDGEVARGYYKYVGAEAIVKLPHMINGNMMSSYFLMFYGTSVEKVISDNPNITSMYGMFWNSQATRLDVSALYTSKVTDMQHMFANSKATNIDFSTFDTSSVINMGYMFYLSNSEKLDLRMFDTSNVSVMTAMFHKSKANEINLSTFKVPNVLNINHMFNGVQLTSLDLSSLDLSKFDISNPNSIFNMFIDSNIKTVYARTQLEINIFKNTYTQASAGIIFEIK